LRGGSLHRWRRIVEGSGIQRRFGVMPPDEAARLTTGQRMAVYERCAPPLAEAAASKAMTAAGVEASDITDLVIVSCTGFSAPGVDVALIERLRLARTTRRTTIGFMGCFGAINGLRIASGLCATDPGAVVLMVCVELCALHMRAEDDPQNQVASALFADGAAAAVLAGNVTAARHRAGTPIDTMVPPQSELRTNRASVIGRVGRGSSLLLPEGRDWMTWRITDAGFAMTLTRDVPVALRQVIGNFARETGAANNTTFIVHPGGPGVLDAVDHALDLRGSRGVESSRRVLQRFGNMSSGSVLFVLEQALRDGYSPPMLLVAFGPGLTIEAIAIEPHNAAGPSAPAA
jgi:predicted naringenin-chalcone synthase